MKTLPTALLLLGLAACSGGPLKELPVFEPPPEPAEEPAPPPPAPAAAPAPDPEPEEIYGAWSSTALRGPGSAAFRSIVMAFDRDGSFVQAGFGPGRCDARAGRVELMDGALRIDFHDGQERVWAWALVDGALLLHEGETEIRFARLR